MDDAQRFQKFYQECFERQTDPYPQAFESTLHYKLHGGPRLLFIAIFLLIN